IYAQISRHAFIQLAGHRIDAVPLQALAIVIDDKTFLVGAEVAGTGVAQSAVVAGDEKAVAVDRQIQAVFRVVDIALSEYLRDIVEHDPAALRITARTQNRSRIDVAKLRTRALEAYSTGVGNVVTGDIQIGRCRPDTTETDIERHD